MYLTNMTDENNGRSNYDRFPCHELNIRIADKRSIRRDEIIKDMNFLKNLQYLMDFGSSSDYNINTRLQKKFINTYSTRTTN